MKIVLINPPYQTLTSNLGVGHQVPLGLLMVGGALRDAGHDVTLLDAECRRLSIEEILRHCKAAVPQVIMTGHAGSTPAHPLCMRMLRAIKAQQPRITTIYGGVHPTYHARRILHDERAVDIIVRGEGEATTVDLIDALHNRTPLETVRAIAFRDRHGDVVLTGEREPLDLNTYRIGWELIERWNDYHCFGLGRAAIAQFSRGCPHRCTYCGQHEFWVKWRYRDPIKFADEIEWLYRTHGVRFITLADENPTTLKPQWRRFLESMAQRKLPVHFFATIRATDIVRDADIMHLYRDAGILYVLMGIETTDPETIKLIRKGSTTRQDFTACQLLKQHRIFSILGHIVGFGDETFARFAQARRALAQYDGDYLNAMYVTPHSWTPFAGDNRDRHVVQGDLQKWDYRHQVLAQRTMKPWQLFLAVKWLELVFHLRPRRLARFLRPHRSLHRWQFLWSTFHIAMVWVGEVGEFLLHPPKVSRPMTLAEYYGDALQPAKRHAFVTLSSRGAAVERPELTGNLARGSVATQTGQTVFVSE